MSFEDTGNTSNKKSYTGLIIAAFLFSMVAVLAALFASNAIPILFQIKEETNQTQAAFNQSQFEMKLNREASANNRIIVNETRDLVEKLLNETFQQFQRENNTTQRLIHGLEESSKNQDIQIALLKNDSHNNEKLLQNQKKQIAILTFLSNQTLNIEKEQKSLIIENNAILKKLIN